MRRTTVLLGLLVGCTSGLQTGTRSDGVTVYCNDGENYYECSPDTPPSTTPPNDQCTQWPTGPANVMWPPNHKLVTFTLADCLGVTNCTDGQTAAQDGTITSITADEAIDVGAVGDGHTTTYDARIVDAHTFELRSERQGGGDGRVYTVSFADAAGNAGSCKFLVPHDQGPFEGAVDSGTVVTITP